MQPEGQQSSGEPRASGGGAHDRGGVHDPPGARHRGGVVDRAREIAAEVARPLAGQVDASGAFPRRAVEALGRTGVLGLNIAPEAGGAGAGFAEGAAAVEALAEACGSTAMVLTMHLAASAVIDATGPEAVRREIAAGRHLSTLALSEPGSRSHFWVSQCSVAADDGKVRIDGAKSWITSAGEADSYVWSTRALGGSGPMTLWLVPADAPGLSPPGRFDGLGLRGNASAPVSADDVVVSAETRLGGDGEGLDTALGVALPWFLVCSGACCLGAMESLCAETAEHLRRTRLEHLDQSLVDQPVTRGHLGRMRLRTDWLRALLESTVASFGGGDASAVLRALELKAAAGEAAVEVAELAMLACGGAAFRKELGVERRLRDAHAARVMAPTHDALLDFIGRLAAGLPLFGDAR